MTYLLINYEYPPIGAGAATASKNLAAGLRRRGNQVVVLTSAYKHLCGVTDEEGITVVRVPAWRTSVHRSGIIQMAAYIFSGARLAPRLAQLYRVERVLAFFSIPGGFVARWLHYRRSIPYAVSLRGGDVPGTEPGLRLFYRILTGVRRNIIRHARFVSAPSAGLKRLSELADPFTVQRIPNGVDCEYFKPGPKTNHSALTLLSVGRLHPQKKVLLTLEILRAIRDQSGIPATARVIGDGPERKTLEKFAQRHHLDGSVSFEGWLASCDVAAAYRSATVLVHISRYEGMSNTILEALASGLPVVASRIPENMELIEPERNGLLFDPRESASKIGAAIVNLYQNPELWTRMSHEAREQVEVKYSWDRVAEMYENSF
ncbi:MAG: glycosyltransferase family 4 protein [Verrucomicrobia bacterium]|nr:glycosyltransferase family 4 protein [Verrucomicrobiota bacterium]